MGTCVQIKELVRFQLRVILVNNILYQISQNVLYGP